MAMLQPGDRAPEFQVRLIEGGKTFQLASELGKGPLLLIFAKESCPTCRYGVPLMDRLAAQAAGHSGQVLLVLQEMPLTARQFVEELGIEIPVALDEHPYPVSDAYGISFVPSTFSIRPDGRIGKAVESFDRDGLEELFQALARANGRPAPSFSDIRPDVLPFRPG